MSKIFLFKEINTDDRDCCRYIENDPLRFECDHYFGSVILHGSCYCDSNWLDYAEIKTVLSKDEYELLRKFNADISAIGYGVKKGDKRYAMGTKLCEDIKPIYNKLNSQEAKELFNKVIEEEKEYLYNEYDLGEGDISQIFDKYYLEYRDRSIVGGIYKDAADCGYEEATSLGYMDDKDSIQSRYFDYEKFGEDLVSDNENYLELSDGRVVSLMY